jgi:hypothetical protein
MLKNRRAQTILPEYVLVFFIAVAAMVSISIYGQRALQARQRDARIHMLNVASKGCDKDCQQAAGLKSGQIPQEYEPYYGEVSSIVNRKQDEKKGILATGVGTTGIFRKVTSNSTEVTSNSVQKPPKDAN